MLSLVALNNVVCLRRAYFEEWPWDQDTDRVYAMLACMHEHDSVDRVASGWPYLSPLNFYREASQRRSFEFVIDEREATPQSEIFVIESDLSPAVVKQRNLTPIWSSKVSPTQIAVPPEQVERLRKSACVSE
ncbi:MAG: hypothetical protein WDO18_15345 [Acidobacteriota bacterium]